MNKGGIKMIKQHRLSILIIILSIGSIFAGFVGSKILSLTDNKNGFFIDSIFSSSEIANASSRMGV